MMHGDSIDSCMKSNSRTICVFYVNKILLSHTEGERWAEGVSEECAEGDIWGLRTM